MLLLNKNRPESIVTWDWREQPPWGVIETMIENINNFNLELQFIEINTGDDQHCLMVAPKGFTEDIGKMYMDNPEAFFP